MFIQSKFRLLDTKDKVILIFFLPFLLWSFLGGHKQHLFGVSTDHMATAVALIGSTIVFLSVSRVPKRFLLISSFLLTLMSFFLLSVFLSDDVYESLNIFYKHLGYLYITLALALFFKDRLDIFFNIIILFSLLSSIIILLSFIYLGLGSWLRVTIPIYENGQFLYFPNGYESSSDPNVLSYFLFLGGLVTFHLKGLHGYWALVFALIIFAGLLTMSRSGFLGFAIAINAYLIIKFNNMVFNHKVSKTKSFKALLFVFFVPVVVFSILLFQDVNSVLEILESRIYSEGSNESRIYRLSYSYQFFLNNNLWSLLFGNGIGFTRVDLDPHFFWFSVLLDTGALSLFLMLFIYIYLFFKSYLNVNSGELKGLLVSVFFLFFIVSFLYWQLRFFYFVMLIFILLYLSQNMSCVRDENG
jgi:hypothetical protein